MNPLQLLNKAPVSVTEQRLAICRACEHRGDSAVLKTEVCKACGCPLANKTKFLKSKCPKGKW